MANPTKAYTPTPTGVPAANTGPLGLTGYQWAVLFAAWMGWGFDVFDGFLFNFVAPNCIPNLLHLSASNPHARGLTIWWTGVGTSILLVGWAIGGIIFGKVADRIGRTRTLMATMLIYAAGTSACALAHSLGMLFVFRFISSLGIGGEWAAGASLVAEVVPERRRVEAGALLYTSAPFGLFLAAFVNMLVSGDILKADPDNAWRWVMACGLIPAFFALLVRLFVKEPEKWESTAVVSTRGSIRQLFTPENRAITISGLIPSVVILITWWSCNAFLQVIVSDLAITQATHLHLTKIAAGVLKQDWINRASNWFNLGGLIGTLLTIPLAKTLGRKAMFAAYLALSSAAILTAFGRAWPPETQLWLYFPIGLTIFGVFGSFTFYLPELFPTHLRATGSGFCYNVGRLITAIGPIVVGGYAKNGLNAYAQATHAIFIIGFVPLIGIVLLPWVIETKGRNLVHTQSAAVASPPG